MEIGDGGLVAAPAGRAVDLVRASQWIKRRNAPALRATRQGPYPDQRPRPLPRAQAHRRMRRRPLRLAECETLYLLALPSAEQQDLRRQGALVAHAPLWEPGGGTAAAGRSDGRTNRHGPGRLLPAALGAYRQGQGGHRDRAQDSGSLLQCRASRNGLRRPWRVVVRIRYRARVIDNLHRRAKAFGFMLQPMAPTPGVNRRGVPTPIGSLSC